MPTPREINPLYRAVLLAAGLIVLGLLFRQLLTLVVAILITVIIAIPLALAADKLEKRGHSAVRRGARRADLRGFWASSQGSSPWSSRPSSSRPRSSSTRSRPPSRTSKGEVADAFGISPAEVGQSVQEFLQRYTEDPGEPDRARSPRSVSSVVGILGALIFMLLTAFYIAVNPQPLVQRAALALSARRGARPRTT